MDYGVLAAAGASFLATLVEAVEALTIVLAVGTVRGWRPALAGAVAATVLLILLVVTFGSLLRNVPEHALQLTIGILLLLFGANWLRKAVLRAAGRKAMHDEIATFAAETAGLRRQAEGGQGGQWFAVAASFKAVFLEGIEIVFIVLALSTRPELLVPASVGAIVATVAVAFAGYLLHRPLSRVPENTLKFAVGLMLTAFGIFWTAEGFGYVWPGGGLAIIGLLAMLLGCSVLAIYGLRQGRRRNE
jgi:Ca2+/H+ antiporter, TMEM165/GDT1 family